MKFTRDELVVRLVRAGELEVMGGDQAETDSYFDMERFRFHGPGGSETDYGGLTNYFKSVRAAFDDRSIRRGVIIVEGKYLACQTWIEGRFVREFTMSPADLLAPNGERVIWDLSNIFRFDDEGRLVEEWVRTDYRSFLGQLERRGASETKLHFTRSLLITILRWNRLKRPSRRNPRRPRYRSTTRLASHRVPSGCDDHASHQGRRTIIE
jgi:hypothetical protein